MRDSEAVTTICSFTGGIFLPRYVGLSLQLAAEIRIEERESNLGRATCTRKAIYIEQHAQGLVEHITARYHFFLSKFYVEHQYKVLCCVAV